MGCYSDCLFFFNDTATTEIYTLSLHDALPIWPGGSTGRCIPPPPPGRGDPAVGGGDHGGHGAAVDPRLPASLTGLTTDVWLRTAPSGLVRGCTASRPEIGRASCRERV